MTSGRDGRGTEDGVPAVLAHPAADSGQIEQLPDGSVSIPVFEEELVCEKRLVVRERVIVRKEAVTGPRTVEADLRREHVVLDQDDDVAGRVTEGRPG
jgi:uncharacterized protein (TIGR02271 family)